MIGPLVNAAPPGGGFSYNPGHWLRYIPSGTSNTWYYNLSVSSVRQELMDFIDTVGSGMGVQGFLVNVGMSAIETSLGVYDFTGLDAVFNKLKSYGLRMWIAVQTDTQFLDINGFPQYMLDAPTTYFTSRFPSNQYFVTLAWWNATPRARLTALYQAIGGHYGTDAKFEGCTLSGELSFESYVQGTATVDTTYTYASAKAGFQDLLEKWRLYAPLKMSGQYCNDFKDDTIETAQEYYALMATNVCMYQNPNSVHSTADTSQIALCGMNYSEQLPGAGSSFTDYTRIIPVAASGDDDNDFYSDIHGSPIYGTPYQTLDRQFADKSGAKSCSNFPNTSGTGVHGAFAWALTNPVTLPFSNVSHYFWDVNNGRGGDSSNQWASAERAKIITWIASTPSNIAPTCFGATGYITGG